MVLQRKRPFYREVKPIPALPALKCYLNRRPEADYHPYYQIQPNSTTWVGRHRQIMARQLVTCLKEQSVMFGIDSIRVDFNGVVKIVFDWDLESCVEGMFLEANEGYLVAYLEEILTTMEHSCGQLPSAAMDFLTPKVLPAMNHPFISHAGGPSVLKMPIKFAIQRKILAGNLHGTVR
ncbi:hypothetical protein MRS44_013567 [Fusarium solani]|uniref:uncharacterized protein n=1 Tax=Fusarium solani TaxID=169388 RepID=UPI0032C44355|nr:hypothetical protein MRS44_013567 [Fusarium solani]